MQFLKSVKQKLQAFDLFILLSAFLYGNLFVISFSQLHWGFVLISCIVLFVELSNKILYNSFWEKKTQNTQKESIKPTFRHGLLLNTLKRGFLLGFFIEAFKVGS